MSAYSAYLPGLVAVGLALVVFALYNRLVALARRCDQAFADIDVQLKQRHDLIPNLVETVRGYTKFEGPTLEAIMKARHAAQTAPTPAAALQAEGMLGATLSRLMAVTEAQYPELKASEHFQNLSAELADNEHKISSARRFLNNAVAEYNATLEQAPANLVGWMFGMQSRAFYDLGTEARAKMDVAPAVAF
jgi:LemA protein